MKAKTQMALGAVTAGIMAILGSYRLIYHLSLFTPYKLPTWSPKTSFSFISFLGTLYTTLLSVVYVFGIRKKRLRVVQIVYKLWWIILAILLAFLSLVVLVSVNWSEGAGGFALLFLLCFWFPFGFITLLWWEGLRGLEQIVETGIPPEEPKSTKLGLACPQCGRLLKGATQEMLGDTGICPKCKAEFVIESKR